jgi:hypothetical protein
MTKQQEALDRLSNAVYDACYLFEELEHKGQIKGNGHHHAQKIVKDAEDLLKKMWINDSTN